MERKIPKVILSLFIVFASIFMVNTSVFATCPEGTTPAAVLGDSSTVVEGSEGERCIKGADDGTAVGHTIKTVIEIMSIGIGILGVLGITIVGIQYLTAGGDENQTRKAKRRLAEIVIGLVAYVGLSATINFLIPGGANPDDIQYSNGGGSSSVATTSTRGTSSIKAKKRTKAVQAQSETNTKELVAQAKLAEKVKQLQTTIKDNTWNKYYGSGWHRTHYKSGSTSHKYSGGRDNYGTKTYHVACGEQDCGAYVSAMLRKSGWDKTIPTSRGNKSGVKLLRQHMKDSDRWTDITREVEQALREGKSGNGVLQPGDVIVYTTPDHNHIMLYTDTPGFESQIVEASRCNYVGMSAKPHHTTVKKIYKDYHLYDKVKNGHSQDDLRIYRRVW